jgi:hypothetical protein
MRALNPKDNAFGFVVEQAADVVEVELIKASKRPAKKTAKKAPAKKTAAKN